MGAAEPALRLPRILSIPAAPAWCTRSCPIAQSRALDEARKVGRRRGLARKNGWTADPNYIEAIGFTAFRRRLLDCWHIPTALVRYSYLFKELSGRFGEPGNYTRRADQRLVTRAGAQQPCDLLLIRGALELRLHRVRRTGHLTERKGRCKYLDEKTFHGWGDFFVTAFTPCCRGDC